MNEKSEKSEPAWIALGVGSSARSPRWLGSAPNRAPLEIGVLFPSPSIRLLKAKSGLDNVVHGSYPSPAEVEVSNLPIPAAGATAEETPASHRICDRPGDSPR